MKKIIIILSITLAFIIAFFTFSFYAFNDYPMAIVATSNNTNNNNQYFLNGNIAGTENGFCIVIRDEERTEIKVKNGSKEESVIIKNKWRFNIEEPSGDKLGLKIIKANANQELRQQFDCEID